VTSTTNKRELKNTLSEIVFNAFNLKETSRKVLKILSSWELPGLRKS
jgi:hypothetical protein